MMTMIITLLILDIALLAALGYAVWIIARDEAVIREWSDDLQPPEVFGEVWEDVEQ